MSEFESETLGHWLRAHANRDLTNHEAAELREFATRDADAASAVAEMDALHESLDEERALFLAVSAPLTHAEEGDARWQRLSAAGAHAEAGLRAQLRFGEGVGATTGSQGLRKVASHTRWWWALAAAAAVIVLSIMLRGGGVERPSLLPNTPDDRVLGSGARILLTAELRLDRPVLSWHVVVGAAFYEAVILGPSGESLAQRADRSRASTTWELEATDLDRVRAVADRASLRLRVIARDSLGLPLATSGDLPLTIVE
ncbi:MAG: hypothetical protein AB7I19_16425 [Planctomycetota bacterium]